jgi:site-specific DNA recombinase
VDGHSLDAQATHIQNHVAAQGWQLIELYTDAGLSAQKGSPRPAFERMLADAREGRFDVIVVDKIDGFSRHLGTLLVALDQLNSANVTFVSVQEHLDLTTPWGKLMLTVLGMLAEIYIDNLRHARGGRARAKSNEHAMVCGMAVFLLGSAMAYVLDALIPMALAIATKSDSRTRRTAKPSSRIPSRAWL